MCQIRKVKCVKLTQSLCGLWVRGEGSGFCGFQRPHPSLAEGSRYIAQWWKGWSKGQATECICTWLCLLQVLPHPQSWFSRDRPGCQHPFQQRSLLFLCSAYFLGIEKCPLVLSLGIILVCYLYNTMNCFLCVTLWQDAEQSSVAKEWDALPLHSGSQRSLALLGCAATL